MHRLLALAPVAALLSPVPPPAAAAPKTHVVILDKMNFGPASLGARVGDTILWINKDIFRHTATETDGAFNVDLMPGASGRTVVRKAGATPFICKYHPGMRGVLKVSK